MNWSVYLLSNGTRTYIGSTTDVKRRLRQHNGEIVGGARSTRGHKWNLVMYLSGFPNRSSACRWERILKCRARGKDKRQQAFYSVFVGLCPEGRGLKYVVPLGLSLNVLGEFI